VTQIRSADTGRPAVVTGRAAGGPAATLSLREVSARYGRAQVLSGIELDVPPESCVAVVGESGSGKTTLARCIVGLHSNWTGEITFDGGRLVPGARDRPRETLRRVQYIFQNPYTSLNPRKTVGQIVAQPLEQLLGLPYRERAERAARVLEDVSLGGDFAGRYPDQLSALDVSVQAVIVKELRRLQRERHLAMIFITHNLALVRSIAQSAVVLRDGAVVEAGPVEQILERPADPYTIRLIADVPKLAAPGPQREAGGAAATGAAAP
jgi:peptide/nickel transport system ATP-binding protein